MKKCHQGYPTKVLSSLLLLVIINLVTVQNADAQVAITRSKLWVHLDEAGLLAFDHPYNAGRLSYPGFFNSEPLYGWTWNTPILGYRMVRGDNVYHQSVNNWLFPAYLTVSKELSLETNYNGTENPLGAQAPEMVASGSVLTTLVQEVVTLTPSILNIEFKSRSMAWSYPKYDDFLITEYTVINQENETLHNFTFRFTVPLYQAGINAYENDVEYIYDEQRKVFVFYDDRDYSLSTPDVPQVFSFGPGPETGDVADPGDIAAANAINHQLTNPSALGIGYVDIPPNELDIAEGKTEGTLQHLVTRWFSSGSPSSMPYVESAGDARNVTIIPPDSLTAPIPYYNEEAAQALKSYRQAKEDGDQNAGNVWERKPEYTTSFGPYTLNPGDSLTFTRIICAGALDWNLASMGGSEATKQLDMEYASEIEGSENEHAAIKAFRENWDAALELIETKKQTGYYTPTAVPPPTVGFPPKTSLGEELEAEPVFYDIDEDGYLESAVRLKWVPVADDYRDPITGQEDFVGYIVYRSNVSIVGPWTAIDTVLADEAVIAAGKVTREIQTEPGIPYRYGVTSFDSEGLESAMTAYTYSPTVGSFAPTDDLSKEVLVVPNPYKQVSGFSDPAEMKRITLLNIPSVCTIRIYNLSRDLIRTIEHDDGSGSESWGSSAEILDDYMLTEYRKEVAPGLYYFHITNHVSGHEGETAIGKFVIIK